METKIKNYRVIYLTILYFSIGKIQFEENLTRSPNKRPRKCHLKESLPFTGLGSSNYSLL